MTSVDELMDAVCKYGGRMWANGVDSRHTRISDADPQLAAIRSLASSMAAPQGWKLVPIEPTPEMVAAYLKANTEYWCRTDRLPTPPDKWRTGTPAEATAESYRAMLAAAPAVPSDPKIEGMK